MLGLILSLGISLSSAAPRTELPSPGTYISSRIPSHGIQLQVRGVFTLTQAGKQTLIELQNDGFNCSPADRSWYRCTKLKSIQQFPSTVMAKVDRLAFDLHIAPPTQKPELLSPEGEYEQWLVHQPLTFLNQDHAHEKMNSFKLFKMVRDYRFDLDGNLGTVTYTLDAFAKTLTWNVMMVETVGQFAFDEYLISVPFVYSRN